MAEKISRKVPIQWIQTIKDDGTYEFNPDPNVYSTQKNVPSTSNIDFQKILVNNTSPSNPPSASYSTTSSYSETSQTSSYAITAQTALSFKGTVASASYATNASYAETAQTASYFNGTVVSASYAVSSSRAVSSSFALTASFTPNALVTASVSSNTITFTKGNGTTFPITVNTGSGGGGSAITLQTNSVNNGSQSILNLARGTGISLSDNGSGQITITNTGGGGSAITLQTNSVNNASQTTLNLNQGNGIIITDIGGGNVTIEEKYPTFFKKIATQIQATPIINGDGSQITYEIALPNISNAHFLWELESRFYKEVATDVNVALYISNTSGTIGTLIAKGSNFSFGNDLSAINRTFWNDGNSILNGVGFGKGGLQPTDYANQGIDNNVFESYGIDSTTPQFIQFVVNINDLPMPAGALAILDFCKFTLTRVG
jgi:hypothetical protein